MSEPAIPATPETDEPQSEPQGAYTPPATQADLDRIIAERVTRTKNQFKDYAELKTAKAELDAIRAANQTDAERQAQELARWQTEAETWRDQAVGHRIEALASSMFADPSDAVDALKSNNYLDAGGQINDAAITADLTAVLERKPHWRRAEGTAPTPRIPAPNPAQGTGGGAPSADPAEAFAAVLRGQLSGTR